MWKQKVRGSAQEMNSILRAAVRIRRKEELGLDGNQYRKLVGDSKAFQRVAELLEIDIRSIGAQDGNLHPISKDGWRSHDIWVSLKTAGHFNLGIALELKLKCVLQLLNATVHGHSLVDLYGSLPDKLAERLDNEYQFCVSKFPISIRAYVSINLPCPPDPPGDRELNSLSVRPGTL